MEETQSLNSKNSSTNNVKSQNSKHKSDTGAQDKKKLKIFKDALRDYKAKVENLEKELKRINNRNLELEKEI